MGLSKEYTYWHLTPNGWIPGETRIDFGTIFNIPIPNDRVLTIKYEETMSSGFSDLKKTEEVIFEIEDKNTIIKLRKIFPLDFQIQPPK